MKRSATALVAGAGLVLVAACGSGSTGASGSSSASVPGGGSSANTATGSPVKILVMLDESTAANFSLASSHAGIDAAVKRINATGGLGGSGHPVQAVYCQTNFTAAGANACARQGASDSSIVAVVGSLVTNDTSPILKPAGLANVGPFVFTPGDATQGYDFPTSSGVFAYIAGSALLASQDLNAKKIVHGRIALAVAAAGTQLINQSLATCKAGPVAKTVDVPVGASDVSSQVQAMGSGGDAVVLTVTPEQVSQILLVRRQLGITTPFVVQAGTLDQKSLSMLGSAADGLPVAAEFPTDDVASEGNSAYLSDLKANGVTSAQSEDAKQSWMAADLLDYAMKGSTTITRASVLAAMSKVTGYTAGGLVPALDFTKPGPVPGFPAIHNPTYFPAKVTDGKVVATGNKQSTPVFCGA